MMFSSYQPLRLAVVSWQTSVCHLQSGWGFSNALYQRHVLAAENWYKNAVVKRLKEFVNTEIFIISRVCFFMLK